MSLVTNVDPSLSSAAAVFVAMRNSTRRNCNQIQGMPPIKGRP